MVKLNKRFVVRVAEADHTHIIKVFKAHGLEISTEIRKFLDRKTKRLEDKA